MDARHRSFIQQNPHDTHRCPYHSGEMLNLQDPGDTPKIPASDPNPAAPTAPSGPESPAPIVGKLRLSQILASLSEGAVVISQTTASASIGPPNAPTGADLVGPAPEVLLIPPKAKRRRIPRTNVTVGQIVDRTRQAGFGFLLALFALMGMPLPGLSVPFGVAACFIGFQMAIGFDRPWVPRWVRRHRISLLALRVLSERIARWTNWMERYIRPRFELFTRGPFWLLCGACVFIEGLGLALPLPIPLSNVFFALPIIVFAIALLEDDGLLMVFAFSMVAIQVLLSVLFWQHAVTAFNSVWNLIF